MKAHRSAAYLSSTPLRERPELFRTAELNAVGWAAVAGVCVAAGLVAARVSRVSPWLAGPAGAVAAFAAVVAVDRRRWSRMLTVYSRTEDPAEVERMSVLLRRGGVDAVVDIDPYGGQSLCYRNGDHRRVARIFRKAGLEPPRR